jgi:hypothetical protein
MMIPEPVGKAARRRLSASDARFRPRGLVLPLLCDAKLRVALAIRRNTRKGLLGLSVILLGSVLAHGVQAQQSPALSVSTITAQDLAKSVHNPFAEFVKVPIQATTGFRVGPQHNAGESVNVQPVIPLPLGRDWLLIARPNESMTYLPSPHEQFGLEDLQTAFYLSPSQAAEWIWGVGPIFQFPTATGKQLGTGRWSAGPTGALLYSEGPWFNGILTYHLMSFAGDRGRGSVNQTYIEPLLSYNFESGWYIQEDPPISYDWTADIANAWVIPVGADVGKALSIGSQALSLQIGSYDFLKHPDGAPQWMIRVQITFLFPI